MNGFDALDVVEGGALSGSDDEDDGEHRARATRITRTRVTSGDNLNEHDYKLTYRFTKDNVGRLVEKLLPYLQHQNRCGLPVSPRVQVELTLTDFAGNSFHRVAGQCHNIGWTASRDIIHR